MVAHWELAHRDVRRVQAAWHAFQEGREPGSAVRHAILRSWQRSRAAGVKPAQPSGQPIWDDAALREAHIANQELIEAAEPVLSHLKGTLAGSAQVLVLSDPSGHLLLVDGERPGLRAAERIAMVPGADWSEEQTGTNAIGTAAAEAARSVVLGAEHYLEGLHAWSCVAAPLRDPLTGEILGLLDLSGEFMTVTPHTEMAVLSAAEAIQARLAHRQSQRVRALYSAYADQLTRAGSATVALLDHRGQLLRTTGSVTEELRMTGTWQELLERALRTGTPQTEALTREDGRPVRATFHPVLVDGGAAGAVIEIRPVEPAARISSQGDAGSPVKGLVGRNPKWLEVLNRAGRAARTDSTILITGETGTGKEVLARAIHRASPRSAGPFIPVNCGALPPNLVASELFGYVGGAFTGASPRGSAGKVEAAQGGTLFLDEVSELSPEAQVALLRVLQEREVVRVGDHRPIPVNVRVIAATNRNLEAMVKEGTFRQDLFFRLNVVPLYLPPLRERREDILPLVEYGYRRLGVEPPELTLASCDRLTAYSWPGNVRELLNLVEQAVALGEDPADLLPLPSLNEAPARALGESEEEERIRRALEETGGNAAAAARALGISRSTLYRKLELYGIRLRRQVDG